MVTRIQLDGVPPGALVAVAMSGGVDSSVTAGLMVEAGYKVIGITLQLYDHGAMVNKKGACCAGQDIYDARTVADKLGIPHYVLDYENIFKQNVIDDFVDSYLQGETPIPCVRCNQRVKFRDLLTTSKELGAQALVTGHYVRRIVNNDHAEMHRAYDHSRDQSYFLFTTTQEQLDYLHFPLGGMPKSETREHARRFGLVVADKPDSQDICFVPTGGYAAVVEKFRPGALDPGEIVNQEGQVLGVHQGIINYTVGQRKGLGVSAAEPLYVIKIDPETRQVIVGPKEALAKTKLLINEMNWLTDKVDFIKGKDVIVKVRSTQPGLPAHVKAFQDTKAIIEFSTPEYGISAGQACVLYEGDRVLGGGWISREEVGT